MLARQLFIITCTIFIVACSESDINIPARDSIGLSQPLIEIYSPANESVLPANTPFTLDYAILRSSHGHHVKIRIDKQKPRIVFRSQDNRQSQHQISGLPPGKHRIRITEFTKDGVKTGGDIIIHVNMKETDPDKAKTNAESNAE